MPPIGRLCLLKSVLHQVLFDCVRECSDDPSSAEKFAFCKTKLRMHFDYEEMEFCKVQGYDCYGHYLKHYKYIFNHFHPHVFILSIYFP